MEGTAGLPKSLKDERCWRDFTPGRWRSTIDVRDFIVINVTPYAGDESFLAEPSKRTKAVWAKLQPYFKDEQKKGVLDVDAKTPTTMLAHKAGYIDRDNEVIVGLQTDKPFRRAIFPYGGRLRGRVADQSRSGAGVLAGDRFVAGQLRCTVRWRLRPQSRRGDARQYLRRRRAGRGSVLAALPAAARSMNYSVVAS
jgi:hypothetical protein